MFLQNKQPCTKPVSSELFFAADPRPKLRKRGNSEGTWSLLSRVEAQDHLYVSAIFFSCFSSPITCNIEEKFVLVLKIQYKPLPSLATAPKFD